MDDVWELMEDNIASISELKKESHNINQENINEKDSKKGKRRKLKRSKKPKYVKQVSGIDIDYYDVENPLQRKMHAQKPTDNDNDNNTDTQDISNSSKNSINSSNNDNNNNINEKNSCSISSIIRNDNNNCNNEEDIIFLYNESTASKALHDKIERKRKRKKHSRNSKYFKTYYRHFKRHLKAEIKVEFEVVRNRLMQWSPQKLMQRGLAIPKMKVIRYREFYGEIRVQFQYLAGNLPRNKFNRGDMILISRNDPLNKSRDGVILNMFSNSIEVVLQNVPDDINTGEWRLDKGANRVAYERMREALDVFTSSKFTGQSDLQMMIVRPRDICLEKNQISQGCVWPPKECSAPHAMRALDDLRKRELIGKLNPSQIESICRAVCQRLTLIQGPPGTGKTTTAISLIRTWMSINKDSGPVLACAHTNVAVDHLLTGLIASGVRAVRIGQPNRVSRENLDSTMDSHLSQHPDFLFTLEAKEKVKQMKELCKGLSKKSRTRKRLRLMQKELRQVKDGMNNSVLSSVDVICCTCIGAGSNVLRGWKFPFVVIDEATQATEPATLVPLIKAIGQVVLIGDERQLPPTILCSKRETFDALTLTLFEKLLVAPFIKPTMLNIQYRMHPLIAEWPGQEFYGGLLQNGVSSDARIIPRGFHWPNPSSGGIAFVDVSGRENVTNSGSKYNLAEVTTVVNIVCDFVQSSEFRFSEIGILTPYAAQVEKLKSECRKAGLCIEDNVTGTGDEIEIRTVDGFQGREKEIIIFSCVRSNTKNGIGFLSDARRLNVAITRAKRGLIVVGNSQTLEEDNHWESWLQWIRKKGLDTTITELRNWRDSNTQSKTVYNINTAKQIAHSALHRHFISSKQSLDSKHTEISANLSWSRNDLHQLKPLHINTRKFYGIKKNIKNNPEKVEIIDLINDVENSKTKELKEIEKRNALRMALSRSF